MSHAMMPRVKHSPSSTSSSISVSKVSPSPEKAASLRGLLLTTTNGDWNALAIRLSACLHRLQGILKYQQQQQNYDNYYLIQKNEGVNEEYNKEMVREAREALLIYAPLAQRLGMTKLKREIENYAFRILYKRQYVVTKSLYKRSGDINGSISTVAQYLEGEIENMLHSDKWLVNQLERLTVMSRVKEPYSLWRKLLKLKQKSMQMKKESMLIDGSSIHEIDTDKDDVNNNKNTSTTLKSGTTQGKKGFNLPSISLVQDAIALRVIIKAKDNDLNPESKKLNEEFLCYYVQERLLKKWPAVDERRVKDYISEPKPNGYQSLHHTSSISRLGQEWPFEVQIRSEDMHTKSEFGVAAHWDYKLQGRGGIDTSSTHTLAPQRNPLPPILVEGDESSVDKKRYIVTTVEAEPSDQNEVGPIIKSLKPSQMIASYINALGAASEHLLKKNVFIFFVPSSSAAKEGKVLGIPASSTALDAFVEICNRYSVDVSQQFETDDFNVYINGKKANMQDVLKTGDIFMVPELEHKLEEI